MDDYLLKLDLILRLHTKMEPPNDFGCRIWKGYTINYYNQKYGMISIRFPGKPNRVIHVHRVVYMVEHRLYDLLSSMDVSHLCGHSLCCNVNHLSLETRAVNNSRKLCFNGEQKICKGYGAYPDCKL